MYHCHVQSHAGMGVTGVFMVTGGSRRNGAAGLSAARARLEDLHERRAVERVGELPGEHGPVEAGEHPAATPELARGPDPDQEVHGGRGGRGDHDKATAHAYLVLLSSRDGATTPVSAGPYRFTMQRAGDETWRIAVLSAGFDAPF